MGELRGRPDVPPEEPDQPAPATSDGARTPTDRNADPRAIRDAWRRAEDPAFADPHVQVRYVTDRKPDIGPAGPGPYRTSQDRPEPEPELERSDTPAARTLETDPPRADDPFAGDAVDKSKVNELRKRIWGHVDETCEAGQNLGDKIDGELGRQRPTGQHTGSAA